MTSGATGQLYGNKYTWGFEDSSWKDRFVTPAVAEYQLMADFFRERRWWDLIPDQQGTLLVAGSGEYSASGDVLDNTYATAAASSDGTFAVVYIPSSRTVAIDSGRLASGVAPRWFDPTDGSYRPGAPPYTTPGANAAGDEDWVLVFEPASG
jgi:hypothetical protein